MDLSLILSTLSFLGSAFAAASGYVNRNWNDKIHTKLLEFELNLRKELNGKYVTLNSYEDLKDRIERLEDDE